MKPFPVILAGGSGTRFWPLSRKNLPKQVLNLSGKDTLIGEAVRRFGNMAPRENIHILTTSQSMRHVRDALTGDLVVKYILEPTARGTAACILLAALKLYKQHGDCVLCVSPSDHYITDEDAFQKTMEKAVEYAAIYDSIVTVGIQPTFPSSGYGYIGCDYASGRNDVFAVSEFIEKPSSDKAKELIFHGNYFWNSGIFIFRASVMIDSFKQFLPRVYSKLYSCYDSLNCMDELAAIGDTYASVQNISIDYGVIERSDRVYVIPANMGWNDIGSWDSLGCLFPTDENGNIVRSDTVTLDTRNCVIYSDSSLVAAIGVEDLIVVSSGNALLICPKSQNQRVKELVAEMEKKNMLQYL